MQEPEHRQTHLKPTPSYQALQQLEWNPSVWATYQGFLQNQNSDDSDATGTARRYLELQYKLDAEPRLNPIKHEYTNRLNYAAVQEAVLLILHPYQTPLTLEALWSELSYHHLEIAYETLRQFCNKLSDNDPNVLHRFINPYRDRQYVYCSSEFQVYPQLGDKVVELMRQRSRRFGVIVDFKLYRLNGKRYPIMQTETSKYFVDPERIIIVERLEPFAKHARTKAKPHVRTCSLN